MSEIPKFSPDNEQPSDPANMRPRQEAATDSEVIGAVETIGGIGTAAVSDSLQAPDTIANQDGLFNRARNWVKNGLKRTWNEHPAVKAVTEAGVTFSKWDVAKVVGHTMFVDTPAVMVLGLKDQLMMKKPEDARRRANLARSGATSGTLSRKMAEGLSEGPNINNPVNAFLERSDVPYETKQAVRYAKDRMEWERDNPDQAKQERIAGACILALAASSVVLAYKGLIDQESSSHLRDFHQGR